MALIRRCLCLELGSCSLLAGIYTTALSIVFMGIGVDELVLVNRKAVGQDIVTLTTIYGLLVALSVLYGISSATLVVAVTRKRRMYFLPWLVVTPLWTTLAVVILMVLPVEFSRAVKLGDLSVRLAGTLVILLLNAACMTCVSLLLHVFHKTPRKELKSQGVTETLSSGFKDAGHRIRQSFRAKHKPAVTYTMNASAADRVKVTIPDLSSAVVLQPANLEVIRSEKSRVKARSAAALSRQEEEGQSSPAAPAELTVKMTASLTSSQQLAGDSDVPGLDNPGFLVEENL